MQRPPVSEGHDISAQVMQEENLNVCGSGKVG
jgi:hypothetical protein